MEGSNRQKLTAKTQARYFKACSETSSGKFVLELTDKLTEGDLKKPFCPVLKVQCQNFLENNLSAIVF